MLEIVQQVSVWVLPVLMAIILHEVAHGFVAYRLGDPTAARLGRLTLNPLPHVDPIGTLALPLFLVISQSMANVQSPVVFGWARPVPVNFGNLRNPKRDMVTVALAGPLTNVVLALASAGFLHGLLALPMPAPGPAASVAAGILIPIGLMAHHAVIINVVLAVFNLIPILPLDGGRVLTGLLPYPQAVAFSRLEPYGMMIVMVLLFTHTLSRVMGPVIDFVLSRLL